MQTRLLSCLAGGFLGVAVTSPVSRSMDLSPLIALIGCTSVGVALGYVVSILFDVFAMNPGDKH